MSLWCRGERFRFQFCFLLCAQRPGGAPNAQLPLLHAWGGTRQLRRVSDSRWHAAAPAYAGRSLRVVHTPQSKSPLPVGAQAKSLTGTAQL